ncbi:MAG: hypothetical protein ACE5JB_11870 [bacterium]
MNNYRKRRWILSLLLIISLCSHENSIAQQRAKWRVKNRLQTSYEFDSNIRETSSDSVHKIEDSSLKFLFHSRAFRTSPKTRITFTYRGGLQTYFQNSIENKLINEIETTAHLKVQKFALGFRGSGRLKIYLNDILDYVMGSAEVYLRLPPILNFGSEIALKSGGLNYQNFSAFDYSDIQLRWVISKIVASRFIWNFELSSKLVKYDRSIQIFIPAEDNTLAELAVNQTDKNYKLLIQLGYTKSFLLNLTYTFQRNNSNSFGYSYNKNQFIVIFGFPFAGGIWLRGFSAIQTKNYTEKTFPIFPLDIDTEREESNFFVLDFSKDIRPNITALIRIAYYNNESVIRSQFYQKTIFTVGFDLRL